MWWWGCISGLVGALAASTELMTRYKDEPVKANLNIYGFGYVLINVGLSLSAYAYCVRYRTSLPATLQDPPILALAAGTGAMALFRSKLFVYQGDDGKEYSIGPSIIFESTLRIFDRMIDRRRAVQRQAMVAKFVGDIDDFDAAAEYLQAALLSFQNLSEEDKAGMAQVVEEYREREWPARLKTMALGFAVLTVGGEANLAQTVQSMKVYLSSVPKSGQVEPSEVANANPN